MSFNGLDHVCSTDHLAICRQVERVTGSGPFDGGCVYCAHALKTAYGGEILTLLDADTGNPAHVVVKAEDGSWIDMEGCMSPEELIEEFSLNTGVKVSCFKPFHAEDLPQTPVGSPDEHEFLAKLILGARPDTSDPVEVKVDVGAIKTNPQAASTGGISGSNK